MEIWNELTLPSSKLNGYNEMIGKDLIATKEHTLIIPLQFWFCRNIGSALPLVALQYHEVKIYLNLRSFQECWRKSLKKFTVTSTNTNPGTFSIGELMILQLIILVENLYLMMMKLNMKLLAQIQLLKPLLLLPVFHHQLHQKQHTL